MTSGAADPAREDHIPREVAVQWRTDRLAEVYREPAARRPASIELRPGRRGLVPAGVTGLGGAAGATLLVEYGLTHARALVTLAGVCLGAIASVLLDRLAPRMLNRTEVTFGDDALWVRTRPMGDPAPTRIAYTDVTAFEVEEVVDPMAAPPVVVCTVNVRRRDGRTEPVFAAVDDPATAAWLRAMLDRHARC